jgi:hypothetical protein
MALQFYIYNKQTYGDICQRQTNKCHSAKSRAAAENYKLYYTLYDKFMNGELTAADTVAIDTLAYQCPELGGAAVYKLENLRALVFDAYNATVYHCELPPGMQSVARHTTTAINKTENKSSVNTLQIVPNPNNGEFTIKGSFGTSDIVRCEVYGIDGKCVYTQSLVFNNNVSKLNLNLPNGVYNVKIIAPKETKIVKLLIIH